jgi:hypothetical protein
MDPGLKLVGKGRGEPREFAGFGLFGIGQSDVVDANEISAHVADRLAGCEHGYHSPGLARRRNAEYRLFGGKRSR